MPTIYTDGGSRGNPGKSAYAFVVVKDSKIVLEKSGFLGIRTNNEAEYLALIAALGEIKDKKLHFISDSELLVMQMKGKYKTKQPHLQKLRSEADKLLEGREVKFTHAPRENKFISHADWLLNEELDKH